jgi:uncharacterized membrane protein
LEPTAIVYNREPMRRPNTRIRRVFRGLLGLCLVGQGINHFVLEDFFVQAMPSWLPWPVQLVQLSGVAEIILGIAVFVPRARRLAGWGIVALLLAVFPANIEMALHPERWPQVSEAALWVRLPFQAVFLYWVWACVLRGCYAPR